MPFHKNKNSTFLFLIANLVFSFLFTSAFGYGLSVSYSLFTFLLLLTLKNRALYLSIYLSAGLIAFLYCPVGLTFGPPDLNAVTSMAYTDKTETVEFLMSISVWKWLISFSIIFSAIACSLLKPHSDILLPRYCALISFIAFFSMPLKAAYTDREFLPQDSHYPPIRFGTDAYRAFSQVNSDKKFYEMKVAEVDTWTPVQHNTRYETVVIVIGESVRRDFMSAYGFKIKNTPFMDTTPGITFRDYVSSGPATVLSLTHSLYQFNNGIIEYNNSIVRLMSRSGYYTNWISNQGVYGGSDSPVSLAGKQADENHFIKNGSSNKFLYSPDESLLPAISDALRRQGKKAVFIHLMGSHPVACIRTNGQYDEFFRTAEDSCYVQSIKNTDALLSGIHTRLSQSKGSWAMVYFSDHGLMLLDRNTPEERLYHSDKYKSDYNVPFFITTSDALSRQTINAPRSGFSFISLIAQLTGIHEPRIDVSCNLLSDENCTPDRMVIRKDGSFVPYASIADEPAVF
jgi:glucan phosphoethanolaminetransferase (alkaline phosphatase superfamily)